MAKKTEKKVVLERSYNVPLRKEFAKVANYKRAKKAMKALKEFLAKHMKSENVLIGKFLNEAVWVHGIKNPPHHIAVIAKKFDDGSVMAELANIPVKKERKADAKKAKKTDKKVVIREKNVEKPDNLEAIKEQKELREEIKAEADMEELEKEELGDEEAMEEEAEIKESIDEIEEAPKKARKTAKK
jgi:large subunit ribosomal protein L31e